VGGKRHRAERDACREGVLEKQPTARRASKECSPEQKPSHAFGASPSPQLHPVTFSPSVSPKLSAIVLPPLCLSKAEEAMDTHEQSVASTTVSPADDNEGRRAPSQGLSESPHSAHTATEPAADAAAEPATDASESLSVSSESSRQRSSAAGGQQTPLSVCVSDSHPSSSLSSEPSPAEALGSSSSHLHPDALHRPSSSFLGVSTAVLSCTEEMEGVPADAVGCKRPREDRGDAEGRPASVPRTG